MPVHRCFQKVDKKLAKSNTRLVRNLLDPKQLFVETEVVEKKRGARPVKMIASHCPFCGDKLES